MTDFSAPHTFYVCTAAQSQQMDKRTIEDFGIDGYTLMEVAGSSAAKHLLSELPEKSHGLYICGKGNNAGDALVVARYLIQHGHPATLLFISGTDSLSPDTDKNYKLLQKISDNDPSAASLYVVESWAAFNGTHDFDFIVDGMLGTGLDSDLRGHYTDAVAWVNNNDHPVYAIDIPTGLHADTGQVMGNVIEADKTYSFGARKQGFYLDDGYRCTGDVVYCELPFPNYVKECNTYLLDRSWIPQPDPPPAKHKYDAGVLYIIAGSEGLTGAAIMAARSAWAEGIGAVIIVCPRGILSVFENNLPQIIKQPVGLQSDTSFKKEHLDSILQAIEDRPGHVLFGPGIGRSESTVEFASHFFRRFEGNLVIDADALWCLAQQENWQKPVHSNWIITPHPGELSRLVTRSFSSGIERLGTVREMSSQKNITVVSKGFPSVIGTPSGNSFLTGYDTRVFARAGFGDVLAGKIGAFWSMKHPPAKSAALGLLNGYEKVQSVTAIPRRFPEPNDLI